MTTSIDPIASPSGPRSFTRLTRRAVLGSAFKLGGAALVASAAASGLSMASIQNVSGATRY